MARPRPEPPEEVAAPELSQRQLAKRTQREVGDQSSSLAMALMKAPESTIPKLDLPEPLLGVLRHARKVTSPIARRREERAVAAVLRRVDLDAIGAKLASVQNAGVADTERLHAAEQWRERLVENDAHLAEFCAQHDAVTIEQLRPLVASARRERQSGKPPGAGRALFRQLMHALTARAANEAEAAADAEH